MIPIKHWQSASMAVSQTISYLQALASPENDRTNTCVFLNLAICNSLLVNNIPFEWTDLKTIAEDIIINFPIIHNIRNIEELYEPISAYSLLREYNLIEECSLSEEFVELSTQNVFTASGRKQVCQRSLI